MSTKHREATQRFQQWTLRASRRPMPARPCPSKRSLGLHSTPLNMKNLETAIDCTSLTGFKWSFCFSKVSALNDLGKPTTLCDLCGSWGAPVETSWRSKCRRLKMPISANSTSTWRNDLHELPHELPATFGDVEDTWRWWRERKSWHLVDPCHSFSYARNEPWHDTSAIDAMVCTWHTWPWMPWMVAACCESDSVPSHCISRVFAQRSQRHCLVTCEFPWCSGSPKEDPGASFKVTDYRASSTWLGNPYREARHSWLGWMVIEWIIWFHVTFTLAQ